MSRHSVRTTNRLIDSESLYCAGVLNRLNSPPIKAPEHGRSPPVPLVFWCSPYCCGPWRPLSESTTANSLTILSRTAACGFWPALSLFFSSCSTSDGFSYFRCLTIQTGSTGCLPDCRVWNTGRISTISTTSLGWAVCRCNPTRWIWTKLHDLVLALACLALIWLAFTWNLMNFNIHY